MPDITPELRTLSSKVEDALRTLSGACQSTYDFAALETVKAALPSTQGDGEAIEPYQEGDYVIGADGLKYEVRFPKGYEPYVNMGDLVPLLAVVKFLGVKIYRRPTTPTPDIERDGVAWDRPLTEEELPKLAAGMRFKSAAFGDVCEIVGIREGMASRWWENGKRFGWDYVNSLEDLTPADRETARLLGREAS